MVNPALWLFIRRLKTPIQDKRLEVMFLELKKVVAIFK